MGSICPKCDRRTPVVMSNCPDCGAEMEVMADGDPLVVKRPPKKTNACCVVFVILLIVGIGVGLYFGIPRYQQYQKRKKYKLCVENVRKILGAVDRFKKKEKRLPKSIHELAPEYLSAVPTCPVAKKDTYSESYGYAGKKFFIYCKGDYHVSDEVARNHPCFHSAWGTIEPKPKPTKTPDDKDK